MDKYENRRLRLLELRDTCCNRSNKELADKLGRADSYVSRMLSTNKNKKRIADDLVSAIEEAFNLPRAWLDYPPGTRMTERVAKAEVNRTKSSPFPPANPVEFLVNVFKTVCVGLKLNEHEALSLLVSAIRNQNKIVLQEPDVTTTVTLPENPLWAERVEETFADPLAPTSSAHKKAS